MRIKRLTVAAIVLLAAVMFTSIPLVSQAQTLPHTDGLQLFYDDANSQETKSIPEFFGDSEYPLPIYFYECNIDAQGTCTMQATIQQVYTHSIYVDGPCSDYPFPDFWEHSVPNGWFRLAWINVPTGGWAAFEIQIDDEEH